VGQNWLVKIIAKYQSCEGHWEYIGGKVVIECGAESQGRQGRRKHMRSKWSVEMRINTEIERLEAGWKDPRYKWLVELRKEKSNWLRVIITESQRSQGWRKNTGIKWLVETRAKRQRGKRWRENTWRKPLIEITNKCQFCKGQWKNTC
jgi:hypothetical protein